MKTRPTGLLATCAAAALLTACHYSNPHGSQELAPIKRLITEPSGAELRIERHNLILETPCDLPQAVHPTDVLVISADGFLPYRGTLGELPQVSLGTYKAALRKARPTVRDR